jgi:hypothetical protein
MLHPLNYSKFFGSRPVLYFASAPNAAVGAGDGGAPPAGGGTPSGAPAAPSGSGGAPPSIDWKTAPEQFRSGYEKLKSDYEKLQGDYKPWADWSKNVGITHDQLPGVHGVYQNLYSQASELAEALGYAEDELVEALQKDPVKTLDYLRNQMAKAEGGREGAGDTSLEEQVEAMIEQRMAPIQERENERLTDAANQRFEQIVHSSIVEAFKAEGLDVAQIPEKESFMLMNATSEILKYDEKALVELKKGGGQAAIQKAFHQAKTYLDEYYMSRSGRERGRIQGPPKITPPGAPPRRPTLDEMAEEPTLINPRYKVGT